MKARFIEHGKYIPSINTQNIPGNDGEYNLSNFAMWLTNPENQSDRRRYVAPVIVPLDLLFLIALGSFLGLASVLMAEQMPFISKYRPVVWWIFPLAYLACDLVEDIFIAAILTWPNLLNSTSFLLLRGFAIAKIGTQRRIPSNRPSLRRLACHACGVSIEIGIKSWVHFFGAGCRSPSAPRS